jgi:hypothetical protein
LQPAGITFEERSPLTFTDVEISWGSLAVQALVSGSSIDSVAADTRWDIFTPNFQQEITFNDQLVWTTNTSVSTQTLNIEAVALHELGHVLGLPHICSISGCIQPPVMGGSRDITLPPILVLFRDDVAAIRALYGISAGPEFDFLLDYLRVVGNVNGGAGFFDDFNDGSLSTPPTSNINCNLNTAPVAESGGFLILTSRDGANTFTPGALVDNCFLGLDATAYGFNKGSGSATITASFRADAPLPAQAYGLQLFTLGTDELVSIFVTNNGAGPVIGALTKTAGGIVTVENVPLDLTSAQRVFLRLTYNDSTKQVIQSFSTNGVTFTTVNVPQPGTVMTTGTQALTSVFGSVQLPSSP